MCKAEFGPRQTMDIKKGNLFRIGGFIWALCLLGKASAIFAQPVGNSSPVQSIAGKIMDERTQMPILGAEVRLSESGTGKVIQMQVATDGTFGFKVPDRKPLQLEIKRQGYLLLKSPVDYEGGVQTYLLKAIELGKSITLKHIYYDRGALLPRDDAWAEFEKLSRFLDDNPSLTIEIESHTDSRGDDQANLDLSQQRADAVRTQLIEMGVAPQRIHAKGYGEEKLLNPCKNGISCAEEFHQQNRRTAFSILGEDTHVESSGVPLLELQPDLTEGGYSLSAFMEQVGAQKAAPQPQGQRFSILLGNFSERPDQAFFDRLVEYENALFEEQKGAEMRIRVGNVSSREVAERHLAKLQKKGFSEAVIILLGDDDHPERGIAAPIAQEEKAVSAPSPASSVAEIPVQAARLPADKPSTQPASTVDLTLRPRTFRHGFLVQVAALPGNPGPDFYNQLGDYRFKLVTEVKGNFVRYRIGPYVTREEAKEVQAVMVTKGFKDAFIVE